MSTTSFRDTGERELCNSDFEEKVVGAADEVADFVADAVADFVADFVADAIDDKNADEFCEAGFGLDSDLASISGGFTTFSGNFLAAFDADISAD